MNLNTRRETAREERLALLVQRHSQWLAFLQRRLGDHVEAEDLLQTAYVKALTEVVTIRSDAKVSAWFYRLLRNVLIDYHRHQGATARLRERVSRRVPLATTCVDLHPRAGCPCVFDLVQRLTPAYREVLRRVVLEDEALDRVAATLGITPTNASVRLHRARQALRRALVRTCGPCAAQGCRDCACHRPSLPNAPGAMGAVALTPARGRTPRSSRVAAVGP